MFPLSLAGIVAHAIQHFRFYIDNSEITDARFTRFNRYFENIVTFRWYSRIGGSGNDYSIGRFENWNSTKSFDLRCREYEEEMMYRIYGTQYWDGNNELVYLNNHKWK